MSANKLQFDREYVISRCVELKRNVVAQDEFDTGARQKLNLGHTFGHSIESNSQFSISHGLAVAIGIKMAAMVAYKTGICSSQTCQTIQNILVDFGLPVTTEYSVEALLDSTLSDKKRFGGHLNLILPRQIGECIIQKTPISEMQSIIETGLSHGY